MNIVEIINKKRCKLELTKEELEYSFNGYLNGDVRDYQMSALLIAIFINDMNEREIFDLVDIFIKSGDILDLSSIMIPAQMSSTMSSKDLDKINKTNSNKKQNSVEDNKGGIEELTDDEKSDKTLKNLESMS